MPDTVQHAAWVYRSHGFSPIPFYRSTKLPAVGKGQIGQYRKHAASVAQIKEWFSSGEYNVGLVTGEVSRLLVLDIDPRNGGNQSIRGMPMPCRSRLFISLGMLDFCPSHLHSDIRLFCSFPGSALHVMLKHSSDCSGR